MAPDSIRATVECGTPAVSGESALGHVFVEAGELEQVGGDLFGVGGLGWANGCHASDPAS
jgi:hypothetical protein